MLPPTLSCMWWCELQITGPDSFGRNRQPKANQNKAVITECVVQGTAEPAVHTLQTGWCFYAGLDAAKRSNVWVASQSPAALSMLAAANAAAGGSPGPDRSRPESLMQVRTSNFRCCPFRIFLQCTYPPGRKLRHHSSTGSILHSSGGSFTISTQKLLKRAAWEARKDAEHLPAQLKCWGLPRKLLWQIGGLCS